MAQAQLWSGILSPVGSCSYGSVSVAGACGIDWTNVGIPGGIPTNWTKSGSTLTPIGGGSDDTTQINNAITTCKGTSLPGKYVLLGSGTFSIQGTVTIKDYCDLKATSPQSTILSLDASNAHIELGSYNDGPYKNGTCTINSGATAGSTSIVLATLDINPSNPGANEQCSIAVGGYLWITELSDPVYVTGASPANPGGCGYCDGSVWGGTRLRGQIVEATAVSGTGPFTVTISPALYTAYGSASGTSPAYATPLGALNGGKPDCKYCGLENVQVVANGFSISSAVPDVDMTICSYCWLKGVELNYTDGDWLDMNWCYRCEVRDSYTFNAYGHGAGVSDADISPRLGTTASLVTNNITERGHSTIMPDEGAAGNVIAYNYSVGAVDAVGWGGSQLDYVEHGAFPQFNLFEGNIGCNFNPDSWHGNNGYSIAYRNWLKGTCTISGYQLQATSSGTCSGGNCTLPWSAGSSPFYGTQYIILMGTNQAGCGTGDFTTPYNWAVFRMNGSAGSKSNTFAGGSCASWTGGFAMTLDLAPVATPIARTGANAVDFTNSYSTYQALWPLAIPAFSTGNSIIGNVLGSDSFKAVVGAGNLYTSGSGCTSCMRTTTTRQYTMTSAALVGAGTKAPVVSAGYDTAGDSDGATHDPNYPALCTPGSTCTGWTGFPGGPSSTAGYWSNQGYITTCYHWNFDIASASTINNQNCTGLPTTGMPSSFFLSSKPTWWVNAFGAAPPWPPIGPDVTGGSDTATAGHANLIPAALCYAGLSRDSTGAKQFDATTCYASQAAPQNSAGAAVIFANNSTSPRESAGR